MGSVCSDTASHTTTIYRFARPDPGVPVQYFAEVTDATEKEVVLRNLDALQRAPPDDGHRLMTKNDAGWVLVYSGPMAQDHHHGCCHLLVSQSTAMYLVTPEPVDDAACAATAFVERVFARYRPLLSDRVVHGAALGSAAKRAVAHAETDEDLGRHRKHVRINDDVDVAPVSLLSSSSTSSLLSDDTSVPAGGDTARNERHRLYIDRPHNDTLNSTQTVSPDDLLLWGDSDGELEDPPPAAVVANREEPTQTRRISRRFDMARQFGQTPPVESSHDPKSVV